ncbi:MAG: 4Fe-4S dicluster domain-containing protein [Deltaproteobacteria bacterium]|nr:4Fe-4S dicluster domain-containing protein [Deltaproteobacteria bacterium]
MKKIVIYPERCTGCRLCESICVLYNDKVNDLSRSRIRILKKHSLGLSTPVVCSQCKKPPCGKACPVDAIHKDDDGCVKIDQETCIGCEACVSACPFGVMMALPDKVVKCELCDGDPQCVKYCMTNAIEYGEVETAVRERRRRSMNLSIEELAGC